MTANPTIRLLILNDSRAEAERLISMLNNAGRATRAQHVESEEVLLKLLQEQSWDLLIGLDSSERVSVAYAIKQIRKLNKDVPVILLSDAEGTQSNLDGLKLGAADVVRLDDDQHLLHVINREFNNRDNRNAQRLAERRCKELERRNQQLLGSSRDAIAMVQDGMFLYVNATFAQLLDYADPGDLECMPVIDTVADEDQDRVKAFLKDFILSGSDVETQTLTFGGVRAEGDLRTLEVDVRKALYEEEPCVQFLIRAPALPQAASNPHTVQTAAPVDSGFCSKTQLTEKLEACIDTAVGGKSNAALVLVAVDNLLRTVQLHSGLRATDLALETVSAHIRSLAQDNEVLSRFGDDGFMLLIPDISATAAQERAEQLVQAMRNHIVDINGATLQLEYFAGVALIHETSKDSDTIICHALNALETARQQHQSNKLSFASTYEEAEVPGAAENHSDKEMAILVQKALDRGKFRLLYQPILSLRGSDKEHYEVLLRMVDDDNNGVSPTQFMEVATQMGAATKIDRWVILESIKVLADHRTKGHQTRLIVNLSRDSLKDATLPPWLGVAFKAAKLPADAIIFQLQEMDINDHLNIARDFTQAIHTLGCECSISHFGCALNPFNALQHIKAQYIKVDGSFTQELQSGNGEPEALGELVSHIHEHEKITIVPFVENASVLSKLWQSGVHYIQGYYLQGPTEAMNYDFDTES